MKILSHFNVMKNTDTTEGRGRLVPTGIAFSDEDEAIEFVMSPNYKRYAVMGYLPNSQSDASYYVRKECTVIFDSLEEYEEKNGALAREQAKNNALEKLNKVELEALKWHILEEARKEERTH